MTTKKDIESVLWNACDSFRGKIDSSRYKDYILSMLFVKYLSDVAKEKHDLYIKQYDGDERRVERAMERERFKVDSESTFDYLYQNRTDNEIGQKINIALSNIEEHNSGKLRNVFRAIDFNSQVDFGEVREKNATLRNLLEDFEKLDLRPSQLGSADIIGDAYEYMISNFASDAGKKGGEFFTPSQVSELVASLVQPEENDRIYDPTCGSGGLLLKAYKKVPSHKVAIYGQELNAQTWALCTMNMFLHGVDDARIWQGDTLSNPQNIENDNLMQFKVVVANPPFSLDKWDSGFLSDAPLDTKGKRPEKMVAALDQWNRRNNLNGFSNEHTVEYNYSTSLSFDIKVPIIIEGTNLDFSKDLLIIEGRNNNGNFDFYLKYNQELFSRIDQFIYNSHYQNINLSEFKIKLEINNDERKNLNIKTYSSYVNGNAYPFTY